MEKDMKPTMKLKWMDISPATEDNRAQMYMLTLCQWWECEKVGEWRPIEGWK